jgi:lantibiotic modifying enzyme
MSLFVPARHYPLRPAKWDADLALGFARGIIQRTSRAYTPEDQWPAHPLDEENSTAAMGTMYFGVEGVAWGLHHWAELTGEKPGVDPAAIMENALRREPDPMKYSYFFGETGIRMALQSVRPSAENLRALKVCLRGLRESQTNEMMAGAPGALLAAQILWEQTHEKELVPFLQGVAQEIVDRWEVEADTGLPLWRQNYGQPTIYLGAAHGAAGNIFSLLRAGEHFAPGLLAQIRQKALSIIKGAARQTDTEANWATLIHPGQRDLLVHWCHGAPGFVTLLANLFPRGDDPEFDRLMIKAGTLVWNAGPLVLGPSLCHGTAGSGAAMLKLFERTGDQLWLDRARAFAMNTIDQVTEHEAKYQRLRYSLWTGDVGIALFLRSCGEGVFSLPMLECL